METKQRKKIEPYLKVVYFQDDIYEHNNTEFIIEDESIIDEILKICVKQEEDKTCLDSGFWGV